MRQCRSAATVRNGALSPGSAIRQCRTRKLTSPRMCTSAKQSLARGLVVSESSHRSDSVQTPRARRVSTRRLERGRSCSRPPSALLLSGAPNRNGVTPALGCLTVLKKEVVVGMDRPAQAVLDRNDRTRELEINARSRSQGHSPWSRSSDLQSYTPLESEWSGRRLRTRPTWQT